MIRAILVDDINEHLNRLKKALGIHSDIEIIGAYTNHREAIAQIIHLKPDVIFLDVEIPGTTGFKLAASVKHICSNVIYVSSFPIYGPDTYVDDAVSFITKGKLKDPRFLAHAVIKLKAVIEKQRNKQTLNLLPVPSSYRLGKLILRDSHSISFILSCKEGEYPFDISLSVESYRTLSKFISHKYIGAAINRETEFLISHNDHPSVFRNLSQAKIRFIKDLNEKFENNQFRLLQEVFFESQLTGGYALNIDPKEIFFGFKFSNLKIWADVYIKELIKSMHLNCTYTVEANHIHISL